MKKLVFFTCCLFVLFSCTNNNGSPKQTEVELNVSNAFNQKIFLANVPSAGSAVTILDSIDVKDRVEKKKFIIKDPEQNLYRFYTNDHRIDIVFINDRENLTVIADYFDPGVFSFENSPASTSIHAFLARTKQRMDKLRGDSTVLKNDSLLKKVLRDAQDDYRNFVDTVSSPAAALFMYNPIDFGSDHMALKAFMDRLCKRFPTHKAMQKLCSDTRDFISIFTEEWKLGEMLPTISLPDKNGTATSLSMYKGKYLLVDFWASWDPRSRMELPYKIKAYEQHHTKNFSMVSISLDPEKQAWQQTIEQNKLPWVQLIDEKSWTGPAAYTFKFDSIPFNFLVNPEGKIIAKALYGDSLLLKLQTEIR